MEWLKANKWIVIAGLVVLVVLFGSDIGVPSFTEGNK